MKPTVNYEDFDKLDIRAGKVVEASAPDWSEKLIRYVVDLGEELGKRVLFSGIRKWYKPEDLLGKIMPIVINLAPKKMGDEESEGMTMMVDSNEGAILIFLPESVSLGSVIR